MYETTITFLFLKPLQSVQSHCKKELKLNEQEKRPSSNMKAQSHFEGILKLIEIYAVLPCSNAGVERGFSCMNWIKTKITNRLLPETLSELMMINENGGALENG